MKMNVVNTTFFYTDSMVAVLKYKRFFGKRGSKKFLKVSGTNLFAVRGGGCVFDLFSKTLQYEFNEFE